MCLSYAHEVSFNHSWPSDYKYHFPVLSQFIFVLNQPETPGAISISLSICFPLLIEIIRATLFPFTCDFYLISSKRTTTQTQYYDESSIEITNIWGKIHDKLKILSDWTNE